jgi:hypothetical protein
MKNLKITCCTVLLITKAMLYYCAGSSGAVHSVFLINVYLDLENPGGSGFWVGRIDGLLRGQKGSVCKHQGAEVDGS